MSVAVALTPRWFFAALSALLSAGGRSCVALCDFMRHLAHSSFDATFGAHILRHLAHISVTATSGAHAPSCDIWRTVYCDIWRTMIFRPHLAHMVCELRLLARISSRHLAHRFPCHAVLVATSPAGLASQGNQQYSWLPFA